jgi:hypothetical protein
MHIKKMHSIDLILEEFHQAQVVFKNLQNLLHNPIQ